MKRIARAAVALTLVAFSAPALACGFDKQHTTTTSAPAPAGTVAKAEKGKDAKAVKTEKAKAPSASRTAAN